MRTTILTRLNMDLEWGDLALSQLAHYENIMSILENINNVDIILI